MSFSLASITQRVGNLFPSDTSDQQLIQQIIDGQRNAFDQLVTRYMQFAYTLAYRMTEQPELAEDIVQECFIKVWQQAQEWDPHKAKFSTWFYRIITNRCIDEMRRATHRYNAPLDDDLTLISTETVDENYIQQQQRQHFQAAHSTLKLEQRTAIALVYSSGLSNKEAADVMQIKLKAFESLLVRAKKQLKQQLQVSYEEE